MLPGISGITSHREKGYFSLNVDPRFLARTTAVVGGSALMAFRPQARRSTC